MAEFEKIYQKKEKLPKIFLIGRTNIPIEFLYISFYYSNNFNFYRTNAKERKKIVELLKNYEVFAVFTPSIKMNTPIRNFSGTNKKSIISLLKYAYFVSIPELYRFSF